ncbi:hypothetical protein [Nitrososphaera sp.]|uniref:hypothetical protein n=1 Tax=Nitrososphaera sp. TaxID=1971748 RepID=UPI002ED869FE
MSSFVFRAKDQDRRLYARRELYVSIRREWENGSRLFFASKTHVDLLIGSGIIEKIIEVDVMDEQERRLCLQNNWYGKIVFERVERFSPPLSVQDTPLAGTRPALLHGLNLPEEQAAEIDSLVSSRIIS